MYFDNCKTQDELSRAINNHVLKILTIRNVPCKVIETETQRGLEICLDDYFNQLDRTTIESLRQAYIEAYQIAEKLKKEDEQLPEVMTEPIEGLASIAIWGAGKKGPESEAQTRYPKIGKGKEPTTLMKVKVACHYYEINQKTVYKKLKLGLLTWWPDKSGVTRINTTELSQYAKLKNADKRIIK